MNEIRGWSIRKAEVLKKNCFAATSSPTCPTWTGLSVDTVIHAERPEPNRLSHVEVSWGKRNYSKMPAKGAGK